MDFANPYVVVDIPLLELLRNLSIGLVLAVIWALVIAKSTRLVVDHSQYLPMYQMVLDYVDVLWHRKPVGDRVAIIGAGGIGFDVAEYLVHAAGPGDPAKPDIERFNREWGIDGSYGARAGLSAAGPDMRSDREIHLLQRKTNRMGAGLGKSKGWAIRSALQYRGVHMIGGVSYLGVEDAGLKIGVDGEERLLAVDTVVICAGQESLRDLYEGARSAGIVVHLIGGANEAVELDAERAIEEASKLAAAA